MACCDSLFFPLFLSTSEQQQRSIESVKEQFTNRMVSAFDTTPNERTSSTPDKLLMSALILSSFALARGCVITFFICPEQRTPFTPTKSVTMLGINRRETRTLPGYSGINPLLTERVLLLTGGFPQLEIGSIKYFPRQSETGETQPEASI